MISCSKQLYINAFPKRYDLDNVGVAPDIHVVVDIYIVTDIIKIKRC